MSKLLAQCLECRREFSYNKYKSFGKYCSNKCQHAHQWRLSKRDIARTGLFSGTGEARRFLIEKGGNRCVICQRRTWMGEPMPLVMDHINGNADDWRVRNCRMICCNCDAQTATYKGRNMGNGRHSRRKRYADGKSY